MTGIEIVALTSAEARTAAALLAERHRADRRLVPALPPHLEHPAACLPMVEEELRRPFAAGVMARQGGRPVGYLTGAPLLLAPRHRAGLLVHPTGVFVDLTGHAAVIAPHEVYRAMYAALADRWARSGWWWHYVLTPADPTALRAWRSLGFGADNVLGLRAVPEPEPPSPAPPAAPVDPAAISRLLRQLWQAHAAAPVWSPAPPETLRAVVAAGSELECELLAVERAGHLAGLQVYEPDFHAAMISTEQTGHLSDAVTEMKLRGTGVAAELLMHLLARAHAGGKTQVTAAWKTANLAAARTWSRAGFQPVRYRLVRHADPRAAWSG